MRIFLHVSCKLVAEMPSKIQKDRVVNMLCVLFQNSKSCSFSYSM